MQILSDKYKAAEKDLIDLEDIFQAVEMQAKSFQKKLERVTDGNEADLLVIKLGQIMDSHAQNMEKI